ncbi:MAG: PTS IIA-like nitrogen regulatory protein PtsN [Alphaproteobacteria bacterium]|nr:PTS IIA-like nitrogen regulatory protein PtsN [Alphaproteobacteria bacterium]
MRDLIVADAVISRLEGTSKKQILQDMAARATSLLGIDDHSIFDALWEREKLGTTGVGGGIAIPHGRIAGLNQVRAFFARLKQPVDFEAVDKRPVDLVFLLLAPAEAGADHLHALATISRLLRDAKFCDELRAAKDKEALYRLLTETHAAEAA